MALVKTFTNYELQTEFAKLDRDYFSLEGYQALLELFDEFENNTELDVIAICCEFNEMLPDDIISEYENIDMINDSKTSDGIDTNALLDALNYYTYAVLLDNGNILYQAF